MKALSLLLILVGSSFTLTACDSNQAPKIENPFAGHVDALQKAKDLERQIQEATDKKMKQLNSL
jgi:hypothetical protein